MSELDEITHEFVSALSDYLTTESSEDAIALVNDNTYKDCFVDNSCQIISVISKYLTKHAEINTPNIFHCLETILIKVAETANTENVLLELLEEAEMSNNDIKFLTILNALKIVLIRITDKRGYSLMWCLNTILCYVSQFQEPKNYSLENEERKLLDSDPSVQRIVLFYDSLKPFISQFVEEISNHNSSEKQILSKEMAFKQRKFLIRFIINMLGKPFCCLDLQVDDKSKSSARYIAEFFVQCITSIDNNVLNLLHCADINEYNMHKKIKKELSYSSEECSFDEVNLELSDSDEEIPFAKIAIFYYLLFAEQICIGDMPFVYNPHYIYFCCLHLSALLMQETDYTILHKGLTFADAAISRISDGSVTLSLLQPEIHCKFVENLCSVIVHCSVEEYRKLSVKIIKNYLLKLNREAQYFVLVYFPSIVNEPSVIGFLVTFLKDIIVKELTDPINISSYFKGKRLHSLVNTLCSLPRGAESDLNQEMSRITASLNFIRFISLRDRDDYSGFLRNISFLKKSFLLPLSEGIKLSRAHFELKLKEEKERDFKGGVEPEVTVTVSGEEIQQDAISAINCALLNFDLIESLLIRVNECIEMP